MPNSYVRAILRVGYNKKSSTEQSKVVRLLSPLSYSETGSFSRYHFSLCGIPSGQEQIMSTETDKKKDEGMEKRAVVNTDQEKKANAVAEE